MKAITYSRYGSPDVLRVEEVEAPTPEESEVLIRVRAAEATKADCEIRSFRFSVKWFWLPLRLALGVFKPRRKILGGYFSGEVVARGSDVSDLQIGTKVYGSAGMQMGAYGEYVALPASSTVVEKPGNMSFEEAAAVPLGGLNALHFMRKAEIRNGEKVLINGAGGSIGAHAIQIAKSMGAEVTAVDKSHKEGFVRRMGADRFIDYTEHNFADSGMCYDVIFDMVPGTSYSRCVNILNPNGRYLSGNPTLLFMLRSVFTTRFSDKRAMFAFARETKAELQALTALIEQGTVQSIVDQVYSIEQAAIAHRRVEAEERIGAVVLTFADNTQDNP